MIAYRDLSSFIKAEEIGFMDKKIKFTPKQLNELQTFFQQNDFTANMTLDSEYDFSGEQSHIYV